MPNDVSISSIVVAIQGRPLSTDTPSTNDALVWNGSEWEPTSLPSSLPPDGYAGGDLGNSYPNPSVIAIQGVAVSNTEPTTNQVLEYNGTEYVPTNLPSSLPPNGSAGGDLNGSYPNPTVVSVSHITSGILPAANQASQTMGGDISGTTVSATVAKIQDNPVSLGSLGSSQDGYVLTWNNTDGYIVAQQNNVVKAVCGVYSTSTQSIGSTTQITNWTVKFDTASGFNTTNSNYVIPATGYYHIDAQMLTVGTLGEGSGVWLTAYVNDTATDDSGVSLVGGAAGQVQVSYGTIVYATAGQTLDLRMTVGGYTGLTIEGDKPTFNYFNIHQL
jgi:hypothetical protein